MTGQEKITWIQKKMQEENLAAYVIPTSDYHQSEYLGEYFKTRQFLSGFTGSAGVLVILKEKALLWADGRYHIQAEKQVAGTGIEIMKYGLIGVPNYVDFLKQNLEPGSRVGIDSKVFLTEEVFSLQEELNCIDVGDLTKEIWENRPELSKEKIVCYGEEYHGELTLSKIGKIREDLRKHQLDYQVISTLDDIAWIFNLRGKDITSNPLFLAFAYIGLEETVLYCNAEKMTEEVYQYLKEMGITWKEYFAIFEDLKSLEGRVGMDFGNISYALYQAVEKAEVVSHKTYSNYLKAIKNEVEIQNTKEIHIQDGVAVTKFMYWLKKNYAKGEITEFSAEEKIGELRASLAHYQENSFHTISAFGANAAMMHYQANQKIPVTLQEGLFLVDSGGQYYQGTTDITRTFALGKVPLEQREHFTLVLKGMIDLSKARFLYGATGTNLDVLARQHVWNVGIDYKCGTGHGVGHFLGVHEGPHGIRFQYNPQVLEENMIVTNEPGVYIANSHGIRIENELLVRKFAETEHGKFLKFETITFAPIDLDAVVVELLSKEEKDWLNSYHQEVYNKVSPFLTEEERTWLAIYTRNI